MASRVSPSTGDRTGHPGGLGLSGDGDPAGDVAHVVEGLLMCADCRDAGADGGVPARRRELDVLRVGGVEEAGGLAFVDRALWRARCGRRGGLAAPRRLVSGGGVE